MKPLKRAKVSNYSAPLILGLSLSTALSSAFARAQEPTGPFQGASASGSTSAIDAGGGDSRDPFYRAVVMPFGKYVTPSAAMPSNLIDQSTNRPAVLISKDSKAVTIANFRARGKFWIARLPLEGVAHVYWQIEKFGQMIPGVDIEHSQVRIVMNDESPILLTEQVPPADGSAPEKRTLNDFVYTLDFAAPKGAPFKMPENMNHSDTYAFHFTSSAERYADQVARQHNPVSQYELDIAGPQFKALIRGMVDASVAESYKFDFHLIKRNCDTQLMAMIDASQSVFPFYPRVPHFRFTLVNGLDFLHPNFPDVIRKAILFALKDRKLYVSEIHSWNDEAAPRE